MNTDRGVPRRVLVLWCPDWPEAADQDPAAGQALAAGRDPAGGQGLAAGQGPAGGPGARAFERVVIAVAELCPRVEVLRPGACAIAARGPARYFGGEAALARRVTEAVTRLGFGCRVGIADGLFAAHLAALADKPAAQLADKPAAQLADKPASQLAGRPAAQLADRPASRRRGPAAGPAGPQAVGLAGPACAIVPPGGTPAFLAPYPVTTLGNPDLADLLPRLGITTLGEFAALPAAEAANRFGAPGARAHRLASGLDARPLTPGSPSVDLSVHREFDPPAELSDPVVFAAKALADQLHSLLAASGLACVRVQVQVTFENGREISRLWRHDGLLSALAVAERVRWQLDGWRASQQQAADDPAPGEFRAHGPAVGRPADNDSADNGPAGGGSAVGESFAGGIRLLRLIPDQLVRDTGRQLGLWGDAVVSDRVARAAIRVQAMLGHGAVTRPVLAGGRTPAEQVTLVPFGDARTPPLPADRPWPGKIPAPTPATVHQVPLPAMVTDESGAAVTVNGRAQVSATPAHLSADHGRPLTVISWAGPWPVTERWWDQAGARRQARFQLVTDDGSAWLAVVQDGRWLIEASYD